MRMTNDYVTDLKSLKEAIENFLESCEQKSEGVRELHFQYVRSKYEYCVKQFIDEEPSSYKSIPESYIEAKNELREIEEALKEIESDMLLEQAGEEA